MTNTTSIITLAMYVDILCRSSKGILPKFKDLEDTEKIATGELISSGLITDYKTPGRVPIAIPMVITPEGASSLAAWSSYLRQEKFSYKFGDALLRFLWVIVGALAASLTEIIKFIIT